MLFIIFSLSLSLSHDCHHYLIKAGTTFGMAKYLQPYSMQIFPSLKME